MKTKRPKPKESRRIPFPEQAHTAIEDKEGSSNFRAALCSETLLPGGKRHYGCFIDVRTEAELTGSRLWKVSGLRLEPEAGVPRHSSADGIRIPPLPALPELQQQNPALQCSLRGGQKLGRVSINILNFKPFSWVWCLSSTFFPTLGFSSPSESVGTPSQLHEDISALTSKS